MAQHDKNPGQLGLELVANMESITHDRIASLGLENARLNARSLNQGQSLSALRKEAVGQGDSAIVVAAGPSIRRRDPGKLIQQFGYTGAIIASESALLYCLRQDIIPDLVVSLDPHRSRILRWFGDPHLTREKIEADDYFSRQDLDESFSNELKVNEEILELCNRYGSQIRIALSTSAAAAVVRRVLEIGMQVYWWNPMYDDPDHPESLTRQLQRQNKLPSVNAGGNVGSACWMMASAVLDKARVAITGMDFSYYSDTPYRNTQYYNEAVALVGEEQLDSFFIRVYNTYLEDWFYTDPAYYWYRQSFLEMVRESTAVTYNCTEGGIIFGEGIHFIPLKEFLNQHG